MGALVSPEHHVRFYWIDMKIYRACLINLIIAFLIGCSTLGFIPKYSKNWSCIKTGMTKSEVRSLLGKPSSIKSAFSYEENANPLEKFFVNAVFDGWYEKWYYGKAPSTLGTLIPFYPFGSPSGAYIVYFDKNETVVAFSSPANRKDPK
jgi:outer membrane protein assembly factor BamE (lipoprotein component of BamABCDE complex)